MDGSTEEKFNEVKSQLSEGLKTCRTVVDEYRGFLTETPVERGADQNENPSK